jgi:hypothetical protein
MEMYNGPKVNPALVNQAEVIQVIRTMESHGKGTHDNPHRFVLQYWSVGGTLLAVYDPVKDS